MGIHVLVYIYEFINYKTEHANSYIPKCNRHAIHNYMTVDDLERYIIQYSITFAAVFPGFISHLSSQAEY